ncbi:hypothetical protein K461DRAFT_283068 [Myriangium duriaei CBS 260.36]|uniref:NWD NACHT-NTPase N-terminal domain-containing protein n=1 Tax=Myriangium duriaei CBS 260.36 TaxID=1168546 RepID=A0A9P4MHI8_9PEZI|nr:hypothetical protein K461DRAFT_283068 [Myriangium duriaei CBS 260.36]
MVTEYEKLLTQEGNCPGNFENRKAELSQIIELGLLRAQTKGRYKIAGREFLLTDQIAQAAGFVMWARDWVSQAVRASPEASLVWAGISLILPLLTNSRTVNEANHTGFIYITARMDYYAGLESLIEELGQSPSVSDVLVARIQTEILTLYEHILEFQMRNVLRFYRSFVKQLAHDSVSQTDWNQMAAKIKEIDDDVNEKLAQMNTMSSKRELERLNKQHAGTFDAMKGFLSNAEKQLSVAKEQRDIAQSHQRITGRQLQMQEDSAKQMRTEKEERCHQLFRLEAGDSDSAYEWHKSRVEDRVNGTCEWLLQHEHYKEWLTRPSGPLLISADPGCGKSVLAKYLVDKALPRSSIILYFFFKDQDQNTTAQALCALLHQMFSHRRALIKHAMPEFAKNGENMVRLTSTL